MGLSLSGALTLCTASITTLRGFIPTLALMWRHYSCKTPHFAATFTSCGTATIQKPAPFHMPVVIYAVLLLTSTFMFLSHPMWQILRLLYRDIFYKNKKPEKFPYNDCPEHVEKAHKTNKKQDFKKINK